MRVKNDLKFSSVGDEMVAEKHSVGQGDNKLGLART